MTDKRKPCEFRDCKEPASVTAYPDDLQYKLCIFHFQDLFGKVINKADIIVDKTEVDE